MRLQSIKEIGALIRDRRKLQKLEQAELARRAGVSRKWLIELEHGKSRVDLALVMRTLEALGLELRVEARRRANATVDIDAIVDAARRRR
jgi:HTH-type transcriptional regulator/antitoxin HipB